MRVLSFTQTHALSGWQVRRGLGPQMERVKGQHQQIMRGFVMRETSALKTSLSVSEGGSISYPSARVCGNSWIMISVHSTVKALVVWQQRRCALPRWNGPRATIQRYLSSLFTRSARGPNSTKDTHLWAASLSVCFPPKAEPGPWGPEDALEGSNACWSSYSSWEFSRATSEPGCHTSGGTEGHCNTAPTFQRPAERERGGKHWMSLL